MSTILDRMEKRGLVKKARDLPDRRSVRLVVTAKGRRKLKEATGTGWALIERLMSSFSDEELQLFSDLLEKLREKTTEELPVRTREEIPKANFKRAARSLMNK
jgi:DNA-binding MarR family transcriptional regulator